MVAERYGRNYSELQSLIYPDSGAAGVSIAIWIDILVRRDGQFKGIVRGIHRWNT